MTQKVVAAVFPGSFDPLTNGHTDIITRASRIFDRVIVAVLSNPHKTTLFSADERVHLIREACRKITPRIVVESFSGLLVDFVKKTRSRVIIRGLRAISDYDYEVQMALMNRNLNPEIETFFMSTSEQHSYISSSVVKQVAAFGGDVRRFVPPSVASALRKKLRQK